jgi:hypothetical protein
MTRPERGDTYRASSSILAVANLTRRFPLGSSIALLFAPFGQAGFLAPRPSRFDLSAEFPRALDHALGMLQEEVHLPSCSFGHCGWL